MQRQGTCSTAPAVAKLLPPYKQCSGAPQSTLPRNPTPFAAATAAVGVCKQPKWVQAVALFVQYYSLYRNIFPLTVSMYVVIVPTQRSGFCLYATTSSSNTSKLASKEKGAPRRAASALAF